MPKLQYAIAALFIAASVGCLALWGWSASHGARLYTVTWRTTTRSISVSASNGTAVASYRRGNYSAGLFRNWITFDSRDLHGLSLQFYRILGGIGQAGNMLHFPIWYPALVFAIAGFGVLRFRRQFSIRSAMIATAVVAALIGMAVIL